MSEKKDKTPGESEAPGKDKTPGESKAPDNYKVSDKCKALGAEILSGIPNMNALLNHPMLSGLKRERVKRAASAYLDSLRADVLSGLIKDIPALDVCAACVLSKVREDMGPVTRRVINGTGVVLHTNLGRAPLGADLTGIMPELFRGYTDLEYDLNTGRRGNRGAGVESLLRELTGAEAALVVNNNAAAVYLMLSALARGKRVAVSRGELVEIGGAFRIPEIMEQSGAQLIEVGTTNRTRLSDYISAVEEKGTELLLKVHTSNYEIVGFTESVMVEELASYARERGLPVLYDMGSCLLIEPELLGLDHGLGARGGVESGADLICFSGDKLMGSAQAGVIAGRRDLIDKLKKHPANRMLRLDKITLAALEYTLGLYRYPREALMEIPALTMLSAKKPELRARASSLAGRLADIFTEWDIKIVEVNDETGGGSLPNTPLPGWAVAIKPSSMSADELENALRAGQIPVITRIKDNAALLSARTILPGEDEIIIDMFKALAG